MIKEGNPLAATYKEKSVAGKSAFRNFAWQQCSETLHMLLFYYLQTKEQNSVDLCWELLLKPEYIDLRQAIYSNEEELQRFRQLVVNVVMGKNLSNVFGVLLEVDLFAVLISVSNIRSNGYCGQGTSGPSKESMERCLFRGGIGGGQSGPRD